MILFFFSVPYVVALNKIVYVVIGHFHVFSIIPIFCQLEQPTSMFRTDANVLYSMWYDRKSLGVQL